MKLTNKEVVDMCVKASDMLNNRKIPLIGRKIVWVDDNGDLRWREVPDKEFYKSTRAD